MHYTKGLRIPTRFDTVAKFVAGCYRFCEQDAVFIAQARRALGEQVAFSFELADGRSVLRGLGAVREVFESAVNRFGRPGIVVELTRLASDTRSVFEELLVERALRANDAAHVMARAALLPRAVTAVVTVDDARRITRPVPAVVQIPPRPVELGAAFTPTARHQDVAYISGIVPAERPAPALADGTGAIAKSAVGIDAAPARRPAGKLALAALLVVAVALGAGGAWISMTMSDPANPAPEPVAAVARPPVAPAPPPIVLTTPVVVATPVLVPVETPPPAVTPPAPATAPTPAVATANKPVAKTPVANTPAAKKPIAKRPIAKRPIAKKPITKRFAQKHRFGAKPGKKPVGKPAKPAKPCKSLRCL